MSWIRCREREERTEQESPGTARSEGETQTRGRAGSYTTAAACILVKWASRDRALASLPCRPALPPPPSPSALPPAACLACLPNLAAPPLYPNRLSSLSLSFSLPLSVMNAGMRTLVSS